MRLFCKGALFAACLFAACLFGGLLSAAEPSQDAEQWSRFRGPHGTGQSTQSDLTPMARAAALQWSAELPVRGHSSPIVWGDRIFLTGATTQGGQVRRHVICLDRNNGNLLWNQIATVGDGEQLHKMNSWATPSCATDGDRVVAFFGDGGLHCYSVEGKPLWSRELGAFPGAWGVGASPIFVGDLVIQNCDAEGDSFLLALDKSTGQDVWRTPRESKPKGGWSTPLLIDTGDRKELIVNGEFGVEGYDPETGQRWWICRGFNGRGTPSPAWDGKQLYVVNGKAGDVYAVEPGGQGDVTESRMSWHTPRRGGRDLPSPALAGNVMLVIGMSGVATGYDVNDGTELWKQRLGGNHSGSPVVSGSLVYTLAEEGEILVLRPGKKLEIVTRLPIRLDDEEVFRASLAISRSQLLARSDRRLYCIGQ